MSEPNDERMVGGCVQLCREFVTTAGCEGVFSGSCHGLASPVPAESAGVECARPTVYPAQGLMLGIDRSGLVSLPLNLLLFVPFTGDTLSRGELGLLSLCCHFLP